ncbi:hypothetical protein YB2330_003937 [Saitoella coloradoensis]
MRGLETESVGYVKALRKAYVDRLGDDGAGRIVEFVIWGLVWECALYLTCHPPSYRLFLFFSIQGFDLVIENFFAEVWRIFLTHQSHPNTLRNNIVSASDSKCFEERARKVWTFGWLLRTGSLWWMNALAEAGV